MQHSHCTSMFTRYLTLHVKKKFFYSLINQTIVTWLLPLILMLEYFSEHIWLYINIFCYCTQSVVELKVLLCEGHIFIWTIFVSLAIPNWTYKLRLVVSVRIYDLKREGGGELFKRDFCKLWRYNENQCWITEKRIKGTNTQNCFKMISEKQSVVLSKQSVVFISS